MGKAQVVLFWRRGQRYANRISAFITSFIASKIFLSLTVAWFIIQAVYMALSTRAGIPPDEIYHYGLVQLFAHNGWSPILHSQQGYYFLGEVIRTPFFLYEYLLSLPYHLFSGSGNAVIYLRLINIALALWSLWLVNKLAKQLKLSAVVKNLSLFMLTNTLMFVFLSAAINYDNLFIPLSLASFSLLLSLMQKFDTTKFLLGVLTLLAGLLVVVNFIPIAVAVVAIFAIKYARHLKPIAKEFASSWRVHQLFHIVLVAVIAAVAFLGAQRYVGNELTYHSYSPSCTQVHTLSECEQSALFRRTEYLNAQTAIHTINPGVYVYRWTTYMRDWTFGILASMVALPTIFIRIWSEILIVITVLAFILNYKARNNFLINVLLAISIFYTATLIYVNHKGYVHTGMLGLAVQGRYWFPILPLAYLIINHYILPLFARIRAQSLYLLITVAVFISAGLPSYIMVTNPSWHNPDMVSANQHIKNGLVHVYRSVKP